MTYEITGNTDQLFALTGPNNDQLIVDKPVNYEKVGPVVTVDIRVFDEDGLFTEKSFDITILGKYGFPMMMMMMKLVSLTTVMGRLKIQSTSPNFVML